MHAKQEVDEDMQQHITSVLCKGRADGGILGRAGEEAQEKACKVNKKLPDTEACEGRGKGAGAADPKHEQNEMRNKDLRRDCEARTLSREERNMTFATIHSTATQPNTNSLFPPGISVSTSSAAPRFCIRAVTFSAVLWHAYAYFN